MRLGFVLITVVLPCERLLVGSGDTGRGDQLDEVGGGILDPWQCRRLYAAQEGQGALLRSIRALGACVGVDLGAVAVLEGAAQPSEGGWPAGMPRPDVLDSGIDLVPDEGVPEDAWPRRRLS